MALQTINIGNFANDGTGDDLRTAMIKINANFEEIDLVGGQNNTISNVGVGLGIYKEKIGVDLRLKSIVAGPGITLTNNANDITITNNRNMIVTVNADTGSLTASSATQALSILGGSGISTTITGSTLTINGLGGLADDANPTLSANLNANGFNIINANVISSGTFTASTEVNTPVVNTGSVVASGTVTANNVESTIYGIDVRELVNQYFVFDFGTINIGALTPVQYLLSMQLIDMGTITYPSAQSIDGGTFV